MLVIAQSPCDVMTLTTTSGDVIRIKTEIRGRQVKVCVDAPLTVRVVRREA